ncbi:MAG: chlorite dismutase family protein [Actinomycetota bacterium]|jgi:peroxiredoxin|nr:chlorite dismutase [Acidimicrobiaceae bacterium]MEE2646004.1 chlorite dismutase family protein [Actinomycetota bacterium]|tara:strand:- start:746 stop:1450 length:705 start_codon:yes stop_codon:yes gene_type:complete
MSDLISPKVGLAVLHLFCKTNPQNDEQPLTNINKEAIKEVAKKIVEQGDQLVTAAVLGHKADIAFMLLGEDLWRLRDAQTALAQTGLEIVDSYVSLTEISEYAEGIPEQMRNSRLYPELPPPDKPAFCFYPMSKRRNEQANWFTLPFEERLELMHEHGASGRTFAGRVLQVVTGSTGVDDFEWGVTLFAQHPDDLKEVVYTMRYDKASAIYAEFGPFYTGIVDELEVVLEHLDI